MAFRLTIVHIFIAIGRVPGVGKAALSGLLALVDDGGENGKHRVDFLGILQGVQGRKILFQYFRGSQGIRQAVGLQEHVHALPFFR